MTSASQPENGGLALWDYEQTDHFRPLAIQPEGGERGI